MRECQQILHGDLAGLQQLLAKQPVQQPQHSVARLDHGPSDLRMSGLVTIAWFMGHDPTALELN